MRKLLLVIVVLSAFACTKELPDGSGEKGRIRRAVIVGSPEIAARGTLVVKLTPESAKAVVAAGSRTRAGFTRSGFADLDAILDGLDAGNFERIFAYDPAWEACYDETGINCWYALHFDESEDLVRIADLLAVCPQIRAVQFPVSPDVRRRLSRGPVHPLTSENRNEIASSTRATAPPTNDPYVSSQWHFENPGPGTGQASMRKAGADVNLYDAWQLCTGKENIVVAVIDEPIYTGHPDLKPNLWTKPGTTGEHGYNFLNQTSELDWVSYGQEVFEGDVYYRYADHGSHVAGVIAAVNNNGVGVAGIAGGGSKGNGVKLMSCQILGYGTKNTDTYAEAKAFEYALKNGAVIAQNSWGYSFGSKEEAAAIERSWNRGEYQQMELVKSAMETFIKNAGKNNPDSPIEGGLVIFAAGNDGDIIGDAKTYPGAHLPLIAVGAMDWRFLPAWYTDFGAWVDIAAPGGDSNYGMGGEVLSTILCDKSISYKDGRKTTDAMFGYGWMEGTSMACPHVSGVAALGLAYASQLGKRYTAEEYKSLLLSSVSGIDHYFTGNGAGKPYPLSSYVGKMGGGVVDALKLLLAIKGTPALYVKTGSATTLDFAQFFGGANSRVSIQSAASTELAKLGLSSLPALNGAKLTLNCPKVGVAFVTLRAKAGDTTISREFAIVSRPGLAGNGGWL